MRIFELFTIFTFNSIFQGVPLFPHFSHYSQIIIYSITFNLRQYINQIGQRVPKLWLFERTHWDIRMGNSNPLRYLFK